MNSACVLIALFLSICFCVNIFISVVYVLLNKSLNKNINEYTRYD